jgi:CHASE2 domain-containing sensor protein
VKRSSEFADLMMPWAGLLTAFVALAVAHQFGSEGMFDHCVSVSPVPLTIVSLLAIAAAVVGGLISWRVFRNESEAPARKVIAVISAGCALLFCIAMILPIIAAMVIPPCFQ